MGCLDGISQDITSNCTTKKTAGVEKRVWLGNRTDIASYTQDGTNPSKITALTLSTGTQLFKFQGVKKIFGAGSSVQVSDTRDDQYMHRIAFQVFEGKAVDVENMDALKDLFAIIEMKTKSDDGDGVFRIMGLGAGLSKSSLEFDSNTEDAATLIEMASNTDEYEKYPWYTFHVTDYATTLAALVNLEVPQI